MRLLLLLALIRAGSAQTVIEDEEEPFEVPLDELEKDAKPMTTLNEQCRVFLPHYRYYCRTSNIAEYNEEVRIICERYRTYCSNRVYPSVNHIRRQKAMWKAAGLPKYAENALVKCYTSCKETDPVCVNACECIHMQWIMDQTCHPGVNAPAAPNCQRWFAKCRAVWRPGPLPDLRAAPIYGDRAPPPLVRGVLYGYDAIGSHTTFDRPRDHGVSFWRGTQTTLVDWPEGKVSTATTWDVPFAGVNGVYGAVDVGFPNPQRALKELTKDNPDPLNPGTGRRKSLLASLRRN